MILLTMTSMFSGTYLLDRTILVIVMAFGIVDYIVFAIMLVMSASIGIYYRFTGGKQKTTQVIFSLLIDIILNYYF
jgi:hypothetical protein